MQPSGVRVLTGQLRHFPYVTYWHKKADISLQMNSIALFQGCEWHQGCGVYLGVGLHIIESLRAERRLNGGARISLVLSSRLLCLHQRGECMGTSSSMETSETLSQCDRWYQLGREHGISEECMCRHRFCNLCACDCKAMGWHKTHSYCTLPIIASIWWGAEYFISTGDAGFGFVAQPELA